MMLNSLWSVDCVPSLYNTALHHYCRICLACHIARWLHATYLLELTISSRSNLKHVGQTSMSSQVV